MRLGIDLHVLQGINQGSKTYLDNIYTAIQSLKNNVEFVFFFNKNKPVPEKWSGFGEVHYFDVDSNVARLVYDAARQQRKYKLDAFHSQYIVPLFSASKEIVTIHDVLFETHPQYFSTAFNLRSKILVRRSALNADQILTVSQYSKDKICELYGIDEARVSVTPNGVDVERFSRIDPNHAANELKLRYGLADYILTVGRLEPRKNHLSLLRAYNLLRRTEPQIPVLAIVGQRDFGHEKIFDFIEKSGLRDCVKIIEDADAATLSMLYKCAKLFVYPSFAEGFGIPPLEAMAAGCPVICSNTTSMKEVFSEGATMIDPLDVESLLDALTASIVGDADNELMRERSIAIAQQYTWEQSSRALLKVIQQVI